MGNPKNLALAIAGALSILTDSGFSPNGTFREDPGDDTNKNFVAPAPPRAARLGVRVRL